MGDDDHQIPVKEGDELFLDLVSSRRQYSKLDSTEYKDNNLRDAAFEEISQILNESGTWCFIFPTLNVP